MKKKVIEKLECFSKDFKNMEKIITFTAIEIKKKYAPKKIGRKRVDITHVLAGILYRCKMGCSWKFLPKEFGSKSTIHRWFRVFVKENIFEMICVNFMKYLKKDSLTNQRFIFDGSLIQCVSGNENSIYNIRRGKKCVNRLISCDEQGMSLSLIYAKGTANDTNFLIPLLEKINHNNNFYAHADKGFDSCKNRYEIITRGGIPFIPMRKFNKNINFLKQKDVHRFKVERTFSWINNFKSLKIITDKLSDSILQNTFVAFIVIYSRFLKSNFTHWSSLCKLA